MKIGQKIYGFCEGLFGRDYWGPARIEAFGYDWVVVRDDSGIPWFGEGKNLDEFIENSSDPNIYTCNSWDSLCTNKVAESFGICDECKDE